MTNNQEKYNHPNLLKKKKSCLNQNKEEKQNKHCHAQGQKKRKKKRKEEEATIKGVVARIFNLGGAELHICILVITHIFMCTYV